MPVRFGNDMWRLVFTAPNQPWIPEVSLPLRIAGEESILELSFAAGGNLFQRHAEFCEVASMSEPFALAIRSTLNRELLDSLQTALDAGVEIASSPISVVPPLLLVFEILDATGAREGRGVLRIGHQVLSRIEALAFTWMSTPNTPVLQWRQSVAYCITSIDLKPADLAALRPGDCLILGDASAWPFPLQLSAGGPPATTGLRANAPAPPILEFKKQPNMNNPNTESGNIPTSISSLLLPVLVVAGRKEMTLEELAGLREGAAIEIGNGEEIPVDLQVNNQIVATGRLVRVADKICASITQIHLSHPA